MTIFTNTEKYGGNLRTQISEDFRRAERVNIASGYVSLGILKAFETNIKKIAKNGGRFNLIVGMAFFEGANRRTLNALTRLHEEINKINKNAGGVKLVWTRRYHGKIFHFSGNGMDNVYIGSSNFSETGLGDNMEATALVAHQETKIQIKDYFNWLDLPEQSAYIDKIDNIVETDSTKFKNDILDAKFASDEAGTYDVSTINLKALDYVDISLSRVDSQSKSNLNTYFGKGRWARATGKVSPRNWFEVEIIVDQETTRNPIYPKGVFTVITDDGYTFDCMTQSASNNYKNLRSNLNLRILGKWIKRKLQNAGALQPLVPVTSETLEKFGTDFIRLYKLSDRAYFMEFKPHF